MFAAVEERRYWINVLLEGGVCTTASIMMMSE